MASEASDAAEDAGDLAWRMVQATRTPLAPGDPRMHHHIPQFVLRRFAKSNRVARITLADPTHYDVAATDRVAVVKDLYTIIDEDPTVGETASVEKILAGIDGIAASATERLIAGVLFPPPREERAKLMLWIALLHLRSPAMRRQMEAMADQAMKMQLSLVHGEDEARQWVGDQGANTDQGVADLLALVAELDEIEFQPHQNEFVKLMLDAALETAIGLLDRNIAVCKVPDNGLVITDRPVTLYQHEANRNDLMGVGILTADEIWVPLGRRALLILHNDELVGDRVLSLPPQINARELNKTIISNTYQELYCHPDDVDAVQALQLPKPDRPLMTVSGADFMRGTVDGINSSPERARPRRYRRPDAK